MKVGKALVYLFLGILFGIILSKSEAISWFRIQEMFRFESFHMYGLIGSAVATGVLCIQVIKRFKVKDIEGNPIVIADKQKGVWRYLLGGTSFGMGWALVGGCTAPMFILIGYGEYSMAIILFFALFGTFIYGKYKHLLPH
ncbi:YeeE/YedE thiosulfate transporter family protein [Flammeovirga sp. EKP202]|uniref:YeeE/YedE thiosulfate transporter family protein n=1 Tax=Flammeovirga sp. EKP202 TaxID=2770592 RepID=UPI00165FAEAE|nr:YeeE/YedE thiosulfate transporter family protein [Flammeovirga sp. EKP202]MBD0401962.1 YeeE/YedE family protein [Flammeovirga sp. EKP202]